MSSEEIELPIATCMSWKEFLGYISVACIEDAWEFPHQMAQDRNMKPKIFVFYVLLHKLFDHN